MESIVGGFLSRPFSPKNNFAQTLTHYYDIVLERTAPSMESNQHQGVFIDLF